MEDKLLSKKELAERWGISPATLDRRIKDKTVSPVKGMSPIRFSLSHILKIEGVEVDKSSPLERKRLERDKAELQEKIITLEKKNAELKTILSNVLAETSKIINY